MQKENKNFKIGINKKHIIRHNFEISHVFVERLGKIYLEFFSEYKQSNMRSG